MRKAMFYIVLVLAASAFAGEDRGRMKSAAATAAKAEFEGAVTAAYDDAAKKVDAAKAAYIKKLDAVAKATKDEDELREIAIERKAVAGSMKEAKAEPKADPKDEKEGDEINMGRPVDDLSMSCPAAGMYTIHITKQGVWFESQRGPKPERVSFQLVGPGGRKQLEWNGNTSQRIKINLTKTMTGKRKLSSNIFGKAVMPDQAILKADNKEEWTILVNFPDASEGTLNLHLR